MEITILGWDKLNGRKDVKVPSWFKFMHGFFEDPDFYDFTQGEICVWVYLLCLASKKRCANIFVTFKHAERIGRVTKEQVLSAVEKLVTKQIVRADVTDAVRERNVHGTQTVRTRNVRLEEIRKETTIAHPADSLQSLFEEIYKTYPRKRGKSPGLKICKKQIKTVEDAEKLRTAIRRFSRQMAAEDRKPEHILYFDSFMRQWTDWLDTPEQPAQKILTLDEVKALA